MSIRPKMFLVVLILVLLSLALAACARDRPAPTPVPTSAAASRGTVAPSPTPPVAATQVTLPGTTDITGAQATPVQVVGATPTAPAPEQVVVGTQNQTGSTDGAYFMYTVQEGDYVRAIAARYNVTTDAIIKLNGMPDPDALVVGQQLKIPGTAPAGADTTPPSPSGTSVYVVQSGDTVAAIARRFGTTMDELVRLNNLASPDRIAVGQKLTVPATGGAAAPSTGGASSGQRGTHVVAEGDTLLSIARRYGVTVDALQTANNITDPDLIYPGQVLVIP